MALLFGRRCRVDVAGLSITEPRIAFSVDRQADETQAKAVANIYNLTEANARQIFDRGGAVSIAAGYEQRVDTVFEGTVQRVFREREQQAFITRIECGDMVHSEPTRGGELALTIEGPTPYTFLVPHIARAMGLAVGPLDAIPAGATFTDFSWSGPAATALTVVLNRLGMDLYWFEADGVVRVARMGVGQSDAPRVSIHGPTEIVRRPVETDEGAELTMFLRPEIALGSILDVVESRYLSGAWRVVALKQTGDNWDAGEFVTWVELRAAE